MKTYDKLVASLKRIDKARDRTMDRQEFYRLTFLRDRVADVLQKRYDHFSRFDIPYYGIIK